METQKLPPLLDEVITPEGRRPITAFDMGGLAVLPEFRVSVPPEAKSEDPEAL